MKQMFKKALALTLCCVLFTGAVAVSVNAKKLNDRVQSLTEDQVTEHEGGLKLHKQEFKTLYNGITDPKNPKYAWQSNTVQWVDFKTDENLKVVTYSSSNIYGWKAMTTRQAARAWERDNPGWKVVAGINGDFFDINGTKEPTNNFMQGGDMLRPQNHGGYWRGNLGWKADGSLVVGQTTISDKPYVKTLVDGNVTSEKVIETYNAATPSATGITLYTRDYKGTVDLTGYKVLAGEYKMSRIDGAGKIFVKGTLTEELTLAANQSIPEDKFYLVSKDGSLDGYAIGTELKCEYSFTGDWKGVQNSMGYVHQVLDNGVCSWDGTDDSFAYTNHPRTIIGFKEDGSTVFLVSNGRGKEIDHNIGLSFSQAADILKLAGVKDAYNCDGGGSSTLIVRDEYDGFTVINDPSDGNERYDGNHTLVVQRDPGFKVIARDTTYNSTDLVLNVTNEEAFNNVSLIKVNFNGADYLFTSKDDVKHVTGLRADTTYQMKITYEGKNVYDISKPATSSFYQTMQTDLFDIDTHFEIENVYKQQFDIVKKGKGNLANVVDVVVDVNGTTYNMGSEDRFTIDNLEGDSVYTINITYKILDDASGIKYDRRAQELKVRTLSFEMPVINKFAEASKTDDSIKFEFEYLDFDNIVEKAYILHNGEEKILDQKHGNVTIRNIDFGASDHTFQLVLEFNVDGKDYQVVSEELKYAKPATPDPVPVPEKKGCGCKKKGAVIVELLSAVSLAGIIYLKRREH